MQFLWGIRQKPAAKISKIDVTWLIVVRLILATVLGLLSLVIQVLGRFEPLSFIISLLLLKNWKYVILESEKFLLAWITIAALCLDFIWLAFAAD